jgi:hypothetical protein
LIWCFAIADSSLLETLELSEVWQDDKRRINGNAVSNFGFDVLAFIIVKSWLIRLIFIF